MFRYDNDTEAVVKPVSTHIDFGTPRQWLEFCSRTHIHGCVPSNFEIRGLTVIDCGSRQVVPAPIGAEYVTLSYVWGAPNTDPKRVEALSSEDTDLLPTDLPQTIEDALIVTQELGFKYLWVDKYCIAQGSDHFHMQIRQMDAIY
ncbi:hypothetical protein BDV95DRAFT_603028 [Massariosphaeria phaeospora]|uniref:Heterokaryon incompatibility domain-containing protein n=1 Tax=Massariosphaeria phaeospora TaxID=100035 RepID=A0A7C8IFK7_9PLEO|nr:hypothetical protein BDV95DRAFT_603028 [Massariosphaeria phaeospora]